MANRQRGELPTSAEEVWTAAEEQPARVLLNHRRKSGMEFALVGYFHNQDLPANRLTGLLHLFHLEFGSRRTRMPQRGDGGRLGNQVVQQPQPLGDQIRTGKDHTCDVAAGMVEVSDDALSHRIATGNEHDWNRCGCGHHRANCQNISDDDGWLPKNEIGRQPRQPIRLIVAPAVVDGNVLALDKSGVLQTLLNPQPLCCGETQSLAPLTAGARGQRPRNHSAAEKPGEFPSPHGFARAED